VPMAAKIAIPRESVLVTGSPPPRGSISRLPAART
jgi:hypothetical protein